MKTLNGNYEIVAPDEHTFWHAICGWVPDYRHYSQWNGGQFTNTNDALSALTHPDTPPPPTWKETAASDTRPPAPFGCPTYYNDGHDSSRCYHCRGRARVWNGSEWVATDEPEPASPGLRAAEDVVASIHGWFGIPNSMPTRVGIITADRVAVLEWVKREAFARGLVSFGDIISAFISELKGPP